MPASVYDDVIEGYGYGGKQPVPPSPEAEAFAQAILDLIDTTKDLREAKKRVPDYTAHLSPSDYVAEQQERRNRAVSRLAELVGITPR